MNKLLEIKHKISDRLRPKSNKRSAKSATSQAPQEDLQLLDHGVDLAAVASVSSSDKGKALDHESGLDLVVANDLLHSEGLEPAHQTRSQQSVLSSMRPRHLADRLILFLQQETG